MRALQLLSQLVGIAVTQTALGQCLDDTSVASRSAYADGVFLARVLAVSTCRAPSRMQGSRPVLGCANTTLDLVVTRVWKGQLAPADSLSLSAPLPEDSGGIPFVARATYLFYARVLRSDVTEFEYAELTTAGIVVRGGARVKNNAGSYLGPGKTLSHTTEEIGRFRVSRTSAGLRCELLQSVDGTWIGTEPSTMGGKIRRRALKLPFEVGADSAEYSVSMYDARSGVPSNTSNQIVLPFSAPIPFGLTVRKL